ncbi:hypothetical protein KLQUCK432M_26955 [Klebsiella quasipneumoniae subsp. similipneumoniae]
MAHDVPLGCAPDEYDDLISGTCSHLPKRANPLLTIRIKIISPPLQHQPALPKMLRFMDVSRPHRATFLMAHLPLYCIPRPQSRFNQRTTRHRPETMPTDFRFRVITHHSQRLVHRVFTHRFTRIVIAHKDQLTVSTHAFDLLQDSESLSRQRNKMWSTHLRTTLRMLNSFQWLTLARNRPHSRFKIHFCPASKT